MNLKKCTKITRGPFNECAPPKNSPSTTRGASAKFYGKGCLVQNLSNNFSFLEKFLSGFVKFLNLHLHFFLLPVSIKLVQKKFRLALIYLDKLKNIVYSSK